MDVASGQASCPRCRRLTTHRSGPQERPPVLRYRPPRREDLAKPLTIKEGPLAAIVIAAIVVIGVALGGRFVAPDARPPLAQPIAPPSRSATVLAVAPEPASSPEPAETGAAQAGADDPETEEDEAPEAEGEEPAADGEEPRRGIPDGFGGRWTGTMRNPIYDREFPLAVELVAGQERAEVRWDKELRCVGRLSLRKGTRTELTMDLKVSQDGCSPGVVHIARVDDAQLEYSLRHRRDGELRYSGMLRPQE